MNRRVSRPLTVQRAAELRLLLEEPLTKPLGSLGTWDFFPDNDVVTLVQWAVDRTTHGARQHATPPVCQLTQLPLAAAEPNAPQELFAAEVETTTAMERLRDKAHARLASLEAAAEGGERAGRARQARGGELGGMGGARSDVSLCARQRASAQLAADAGSDDARDFRDARLALRRAYAAHKQRFSSARAAAHSQQLEPLLRTCCVKRRRARAAWLWAAGLGACAMLLTYALTLQLMLQRESSLSQPVSAGTTTVMREQGDRCLLSAPVSSVDTAKAASSQPAGVSRPQNARRRAERRARD